MKKALSLLLVLAMVLSLMPTVVFAAEEKTTISFETTFEEGMTVGETFTVKAILANNDLFGAMTLTLDWNEDVVNFTGFDTDRRGALVTEVFTYTSAVFNQELGIVNGVDELGYDTNGVIFTANFEIVGSGDMKLGFKDADATEFQIIDIDCNDIDVIVDYSAIENLSVAGDDVVVIPDDAPFTAITTDAGDILAIEQQDDVNGVPYYIVTIPEDAETAYVTAPDQVVMEDWNTGEMQATAYAYEIENGWNQLFISYNYEESEDGPVVEIPMYMVPSDWSGEVELCFVEDEDGYLTHAFGIEDAGFACLGIISFRYGTASEGGEEEPTYSITVDQPIGGTVTVDKSKAAAGEEVFVNHQAASGYRFKNFKINGIDTYLENGVLMMPAEDVIISAVFEAVHTCNYNQETVAEKYLKDEATCQSGAVYYKSCTCGEFVDTAETFVSGDPVACVYENGACKWCGAAEPVLAPGFRFATSADVSAENGGTAVVKVMITGHSDSNVTKYNAYDITLTFDSNKLVYQGYDGAVKSDNGSVTVTGNTIRIVGCGADKDFGTEIAALTFKTKAEGAASVTISKVQVSDKNESVKVDASVATPMHKEGDTTADATPNISVVVVPYSVTKPGFISGNDKILHGETYTFSYTDTANYTYSDLTVKVGGVAVEELTADENGVYTIENVAGAIEITATQTPNSYDVTKPANVTGSDKATYGTDYVFTVTPSEGKEIESVTVTIGGKEIELSINAEGKYVIPGNAISGSVTITVTEKDKAATETTITFTGVEASEVEGGLTQTATIGQAFSFKLNKVAGYAYTVKVGTTELTETGGQYAIPADLVVAEGVTVIIEKVDNTTATVDVTEYISLDSKVMFLVTAKWGDKVLAYGEEGTMFRSNKYTVTGETEAGAYCWLVVSADNMNTVELVKAAAEAAIVEAAEGATATAIKYNYDINGTTKVDVNDAQLAYDMYNASYMEFNDNLPMLKFLEADMSTDMKLDTQDVAAIISYIVNGANA